MSFLKLRLEGKGPTGRNHRVFLNDQDITHAVSELSLHIGHDQVNQVSLTFYADVEIPDEVLTMVREATLAARNPRLR